MGGESLRVNISGYGGWGVGGRVLGFHVNPKDLHFSRPFITSSFSTSVSAQILFLLSLSVFTSAVSPLLCSFLSFA